MSRAVMQIELDAIRRLASELFPPLDQIIFHDSSTSRSTWETSLQTGKAVEFLSTCAIAAATRRLGISVTVPELYEKDPDLFYLRNILPRHHGAQAGHAAIQGDLSLADRFVAALTPRLVIHTRARSFGVYREGFPIHLLHVVSCGNQEYLDRPDILVVQGSMRVVASSMQEVAFWYSCDWGNCEGVLRVKNDVKLPVKSYASTLKDGIPTVGIIECSVGKSTSHASSQVARYLGIFETVQRPVTLLVNGLKTGEQGYDFETKIDLRKGTIADLRELLLAGATAFAARALS